MKIEKLYTLSQFIDLMDELYPPSEPETAEEYQLYVSGYNYFIKQSPTRDMFVSSVLMPIFPNTVGLTEFEQKLLDKYELAQKKVIFDGMKPISGGNQFVCDSGYKGAFRVICPNDFKTLHDLAEATSGELKLKNVDI